MLQRRVSGQLPGPPGVILLRVRRLGGQSGRRRRGGQLGHWLEPVGLVRGVSGQEVTIIPASAFDINSWINRFPCSSKPSKKKSAPAKKDNPGSLIDFDNNSTKKSASGDDGWNNNWEDDAWESLNNWGKVYRYKCPWPSSMFLKRTESNSWFERTSTI